VFNYDDKRPQTITVSLERIHPAFAANATASFTDVSTDKVLSTAHGAITVELAPAESKLLELHRED
jgi:hypothetical protein